MIIIPGVSRRLRPTITERPCERGEEVIRLACNACETKIDAIQCDVTL